MSPSQHFLFHAHLFTPAYPHASPTPFLPFHPYSPSLLSPILLPHSSNLICTSVLLSSSLPHLFIYLPPICPVFPSPLLSPYLIYPPHLTLIYNIPSPTSTPKPLSYLAPFTSSHLLPPPSAPFSLSLPPHYPQKVARTCFASLPFGLLYDPHRLHLK